MVFWRWWMLRISQAAERIFPGCSLWLSAEMFSPRLTGLFVKGVDPQFGHAVIVEHDDEIIFDFVHINVRSDVLGLFIGKFPPRLGFQSSV